MTELLGILLAGVHRLQQNIVPVLLECEVLPLNLEQEVWMIAINIWCKVVWPA
jgi:hypothetical protein